MAVEAERQVLARLADVRAVSRAPAKSQGPALLRSGPGAFPLVPDAFRQAPGVLPSVLVEHQPVALRPVDLGWPVELGHC